MQALSAPFIQLLVYLPEARIKCHIFPGCIFILIQLKKDTLGGFENKPQSSIYTFTFYHDYRWANIANLYENLGVPCFLRYCRKYIIESKSG